MSFTIHDFMRSEGLHPDLSVEDVQEYYGAALNEYETSTEAFETTLDRFEYVGLTEEMLADYVTDLQEYGVDA